MATLGDRIGTVEMSDPTTEHADITAVAVDFESFYRNHHQSILRVALAMTSDLQVAEDLTQDAFVITRRQWARIAGFDRPELWVRRVVINLAGSRWRRAGREARALLRLGHRTPTHAELAPPDPELWAAIAALPTRQAQVIVLAVVEDLPIGDIARILDCGPETVRTHLRRAKARLAALLDEDQT